MNNIKIGYFGDGKWAHKALDLLIDDSRINVEFICPRFSTKDDFLKLRSKKFKIDYVIEKDINSLSFINYVKRKEIDLIVSMSFDQIFKKEVFTIPKYGSVNCHAGKLPYYRGRNILNWVLINDEKEFGITVHYIDEGIDTGDIIAQKTFQIDDNDSYKSLLEKAYIECPSLLKESINQLIDGNFNRIKQDSIASAGTICSKRVPGDEIIDWQKSSRYIFNFVRALNGPSLSATTFLNKKEIKIFQVEEINNAPNYIGIPGSILSKDKFGYIVKTGDSYIKIVNWSKENKLVVGQRFL